MNKNHTHDIAYSLNKRIRLIASSMRYYVQIKGGTRWLDHLSARDLPTALKLLDSTIQQYS